MTIDGFSVSWWVIVPVLLALVVFGAIVAVWGVKAHKTKISAGVEEMIGRKALAKTTLKPRGDVFVEGELWAAISESGDIEPGQEVIISKIEGLTLYVTRKISV